MRRFGLNGSDGQHRRRSFSVDPVKPCAALFVSPVSNSETRIGGCSVGARDMPTPTPTWTGPPSHSHGAIGRPGRTFIAAEHPSQLSCG